MESPKAVGRFEINKKNIWDKIIHLGTDYGRHKSKKSENLGLCGRQNMLWPYLKIWEWDLIFGRALKAISSLGIPTLCFLLNVFFSTVAVHKNTVRLIGNIE